MPFVAIQIDKFVDEYQPGIVECHLTDAHGEIHFFVEKVPYVSTENLWWDSDYPRPGSIACEVVDEWVDEFGRQLARISTETPWSIASTTGSTLFIVFSAQMMMCRLG